MPNMMKPRPKDPPIVLPPHRPPKRTRRKMKEQRFWLVHITNPAYRPKIKALKTWLAPITFKKSITIHQRRQWNKLFLTISLKTERVKILWEVVNIVKLFWWSNRRRPVSSEVNPSGTTKCQDSSLKTHFNPSACDLTTNHRRSTSLQDPSLLMIENVLQYIHIDDGDGMTFWYFARIIEQSSQQKRAGC